jgi:hypothetical protein
VFEVGEPSDSNGEVVYSHPGAFASCRPRIDECCILLDVE